MKMERKKLGVVRMNELELILKILESNKKSADYSEEDISRFSSLYEKIINILQKKSSLSLITDDDIEFLKEKSVIEKDNDNLKNYVMLLGTYAKVINPEQKSELIELTDKELQNIIVSLTEISKVIDNTEVNNLIKKVSNGFNDFTEADLDLLHKFILESNLTDAAKRDVTLYVLLNSVQFDNLMDLPTNADNQIDVDDKYAKDFEEIELSRKGLTEEECIELFAKYGYDFKKLGRRNDLETNKPVAAQELIKEKGNYEQIEKILQLLRDNNIDLNDNCGHNILREKGNNLAHIFVKSNDRCVKEIIDFSEQYGFVDDGIPNFYKMVITTRKFILRKIKYKPTINTGKGPGHPGNDSIGGSHEDFMANVKLFSDICSRIHTDRVVFLKQYFEKYNGELLDEPHDKITGMIDILKKYGYEERDYFDRATSIFRSSHVTDVLDLAVELDLLDDYVKSNPSTLLIGNDKTTRERLYILSKNKDKLLQQTTIPNFIGESIVKKKIKIGGIPEIDSLIEHTDIVVGINDITDQSVVERYENRIKEQPADITIDEDDLESPVNILDSKYKVDDTLYDIDGIRISRLKVIRVYNALKDMEGVIDVAKNAIVKYAIARNSFLTPKEINRVMDAYNDAKLDYSDKKRKEL
jgi:hypothetical protein